MDYDNQETLEAALVLNVHFPELESMTFDINLTEAHDLTSVEKRLSYEVSRRAARSSSVPTLLFDMSFSRTETNRTT